MELWLAVQAAPDRARRGESAFGSVAGIRALQMWKAQAQRGLGNL
jgi:hypothetical protein